MCSHKFQDDVMSSSDKCLSHFFFFFNLNYFMRYMKFSVGAFNIGRKIPLFLRCIARWTKKKKRGGGGSEVI